MNEITPQMLQSLPEDVRTSLIESGMLASVTETPQESPSVEDAEFTEVTDPVEDVSEEFTRFKDAPWFAKAQDQRILMVGAGGIGSWTAVLLGKLGVHIILMDSDFFELHNIAGQLCSMESVKRRESKVYAVSRMVSEVTSTYVSSYNRRWSPGGGIEKIVIAAVDNMTTRKELYLEWKQTVEKFSDAERKEWLFLDGRLAAESYQLLTIRGDNPNAMERYEKEFLFSDEEADNTVCSYKQTAFMACILAGRIVNQYVNFCNNLVSEFPRPIPFFIEYDGTIGYYHTEASCL